MNDDGPGVWGVRTLTSVLVVGQLPVGNTEPPLLEILLSNALSPLGPLVHLPVDRNAKITRVRTQTARRFIAQSQIMTKIHQLGTEQFSRRWTMLSPKLNRSKFRKTAHVNASPLTLP